MIPNGFKPLLAIDFNKVTEQPTKRMVSEKLDGIRCAIFGGVAYSRSLKPIPNKFVQAWAQENARELEGFDGELIIGDRYSPTVFNSSTSGVMTIAGEPDFTYWAFDKYHPTKPYYQRYQDIMNCHIDRVEVLEHYIVGSQDEVTELERKFLDLGAEGAMIRDADGRYKSGRSGKIRPELQKIKQFVDSEFVIIGWEPKYHNANEAVINELGLTERSTAKDGMIPLDTMGSLILQMEDGTQFSCGSGFTDEIRENLWNMRNELAGKLAKVKYFDNGPSGYLVPRFPIFLGIRDKSDT
jgi:DNA ligase-1